MRRGKDWPGETPAPGDLRLVQIFLGTAGYGGDEGEAVGDALATPAALAAWLGRQGYLDADASVSREEHAQTLDLRQALRALLRSHRRREADPRAIEHLDRLAMIAICRPRFADDGGIRFEAAGTGVQGFFGKLLATVALAQRDGIWSRLKICDNDACRRVFWDASNNRQSRWCSTRRCGNRINAIASRRRQGIRPRKPAKG